MATLKSQKMERSRDLKTPLATSTMDKPKGGPGGGKKKKVTKTYVKTSAGNMRQYKPGEFEKERGFNNLIQNKKLKKTKRSDGSIQYTYV